MRYGMLRQFLQIVIQSSYTVALLDPYVNSSLLDLHIIDTIPASYVSARLRLKPIVSLDKPCESSFTPKTKLRRYVNDWLTSTELQRLHLLNLQLTHSCMSFHLRQPDLLSWADEIT
jgi:hypothetical protein